MRAGHTLVVWKLDRLARSVKQLIETVEGLDARGIGFRSLTETIDTTTPGGKLVFQIFGALAEFERSIIRERTKAGLASARARGRPGGRPPALSAEDLAAARALLSDPDITVDAVARRLGVAPLDALSAPARRPERNEWRFYRIDIWPDLFGGVSLVRQWGRIGHHGQCRHDPYPSEAEALAAAQKLLAVKARRGYRDA